MSNGPIKRKDVLKRINAAFVARDPRYNDIRSDLRGGLEELNSRMDALIAAGYPIPVSQQISLEAQWLINYTEEWDRAAATLQRFQQSLAATDQALSQQDDGSWGPGCTEFYRKLEPTVDALQNRLQDGVPIKPLKFMQQLQDPQFVRDYLEGLRVSRIHRDGRNNRDAFGSMITSLTQLFFKQKLRKKLDQHKEADFKISDASITGLRDYLWSIQGTETGYWGPTYDFDGDIIDVQDLSYTFHVVKYYCDRTGTNRTDLPKIDQIAATTRTIQTFCYPNGLKPDQWENGHAPQFSDHNNYDLTTMFKTLWPDMPEEGRTAAGQEITALLAWCLTTSLQDDHFERSPDMSVVNSYNYGVLFLQIAGFWPQIMTPFWTNSPIAVPPGTASPAAIAARLLKGFRPYDDDSDVARAVRTTLTAASGGGPVG